jgi:hypothetical protein
MREAVCVGGGPTAPEFYPWILASGLPVFAASTMLLPLQRAGIKVDVTCIIDGSVVMPLHFAGALSDGELVHVPAVQAEIPANWQGPKTVRYAKDCPGSTVLLLCVNEAVRRGAEVVHLVGADFCYGGGRSHAAGVVTAYDIDMHEPRETENGNGEKVRTERSLLHYRGELDIYVMEHPGVRFIKHGRNGTPTIGAEWAAP